MTLTSSAPTLREAIYELAMADRAPDAALLDECVRRFPQYGQELTEFAVEMAMEALAERATPEGGETVQPGVVSPAVSRAMSRFQNQLHAVEQREQAREDQGGSAAAVNPFASLPREEFRALAGRMGVNTLFLIKLRDRQIDPQTMTDGFKRMVADETRAPLDVVIAHLSAPPMGLGARRQFYKADEKPAAVDRQSFLDAVRSSGLSQSEQERLLGL